MRPMLLALLFFSVIALTVAEECACVSKTATEQVTFSKTVAACSTCAFLFCSTEGIPGLNYVGASWICFPGSTKQDPVVRSPLVNAPTPPPPLASPTAPKVAVQWAMPQLSPASPITVSQNTVLFFNWIGTHDISTVATQAEFDACDFSKATVFEKVASDGSSNVIISSVGTIYFVCTQSTHCKNGMKLKVISNPANSTPTPVPVGGTPTPHIAPGTPTPAGSTPTPAGSSPTPAGSTPTPGGGTIIIMPTDNAALSVSGPPQIWLLSLLLAGLVALCHA